MINNIYLGDCLEILNNIPDKSVNLVATDLPYQATCNDWDSLIAFREHYIIKGKVIEGFSNIDLMQEHEIDDFINYLVWKRLYKRNEVSTPSINYKNLYVMRDDFLDELRSSYRPLGLWDHYERILKDNGAIVSTAMQPFTSKLVMSNLKMFKYTQVWKKTTPTGFLNAKKQPLRIHEDIAVFYNKQCTYNPQKTTGHSPVHSYTKHTTDGNNYGKTKKGVSGGGSTERFPTTVLEFPTDKQKSSLHSCQKPVALYEYLIKTYSNEGDIVLDNCMGSGTTIIAALNTNRKYIGIEKDEEIFNKAKNRIDNHIKVLNGSY